MAPNALAHALDNSTTGHLGGLPGTVGHFWFWAQFSDEKGNLAGWALEHSHCPAHFLGPAPATKEPGARHCDHFPTACEVLPLGPWARGGSTSAVHPGATVLKR